MTSQKDLNKDMVALLSSVTDSIHQLRSEVVALRSDMNSQHMRNNNFNYRLINLEENKMKTIDEEIPAGTPSSNVVVDHYPLTSLTPALQCW